jgi:hypothetical protein
MNKIDFNNQELSVQLRTISFYESSTYLPNERPVYQYHLLKTFNYLNVNKRLFV